MAELSSDFDVVVIGGGAAGVAACKHLVDAKIDAVILEARVRLGGRAWTVPTEIGYPVDLGCEWLHSAEINPWAEIAIASGFALDKTLPDWTSRITLHVGEAANAEWLAARDDFEAAYERAAQACDDVAAATLLPPRGRWNQLFNAISTWANGAELPFVSVKDRQNYDNTALNWRALAGYGSLISGYGANLPVRFGTIVENIDHRGRTLRIATSRGEVAARAAIVTVSTNIIAAGTLRFSPALPGIVDAAAGLPCGVADKLFLALDGPEPSATYRHLIGRIDRTETGNYQLRPHGWPMISCYFGGTLAARLEQEGEAGMAAFAIDELAGIYGNAIRNRLRPLAHSAWAADPFARGSYSCALPGHVDDRSTLMQPVEERIFFAGEACSRDQFGTAHAAYTSGVAAAARAIAMLQPHRDAVASPAAI